MQKKLTITVDEDVYDGLKEVIGPRKISRFVEDLIRPHVIKPTLDMQYKRMAEDEERESEALESAEATRQDAHSRSVARCGGSIVTLQGI